MWVLQLKEKPWAEATCSPTYILGNCAPMLLLHSGHWLGEGCPSVQLGGAGPGPGRNSIATGLDTSGSVQLGSLLLVPLQGFFPTFKKNLVCFQFCSFLVSSCNSMVWPWLPGSLPLSSSSAEWGDKIRWKNSWIEIKQGDYLPNCNTGHNGLIWGKKIKTDLDVEKQRQN